MINRFEKELNNPSTNYFIFDTKGVAPDVDFKQYVWHRSQYNRASPGDLFIYRRPMSVSENGEFYFFGACKIENISGEEKATAFLSKKSYFNEYIFQRDLENFSWTFKERGENWEHFFNQYGMNKINKVDFVNILKLAEPESTEYQYVSDEAEIEAIQKIQSQNYFVEDQKSEVAIRSNQSVFSNKVKL